MKTSSKSGNRVEQKSFASQNQKSDADERRLRKLKVFLKSVSYNGSEGTQFETLNDLYSDVLLLDRSPCSDQLLEFKCNPTPFLVASCFNRTQVSTKGRTPKRARRTPKKAANTSTIPAATKQRQRTPVKNPVILQNAKSVERKAIPDRGVGSGKGRFGSAVASSQGRSIPPAKIADKSSRRLTPSPYSRQTPDQIQTSLGKQRGVNKIGGKCSRDEGASIVKADSENARPGRGKTGPCGFTVNTSNKIKKESRTEHDNQSHPERTMSSQSKTKSPKIQTFTKVNAAKTNSQTKTDSKETDAKKSPGQTSPGTELKGTKSPRTKPQDSKSPNKTPQGKEGYKLSRNKCAAGSESQDRKSTGSKKSPGTDSSRAMSAGRESEDIQRTKSTDRSPNTRSQDTKTQRKKPHSKQSPKTPSSSLTNTRSLRTPNTPWPYKGSLRSQKSPPNNNTDQQKTKEPEKSKKSGDMSCKEKRYNIRKK